MASAVKFQGEMNPGAQLAFLHYSVQNCNSGNGAAHRSDRSSNLYPPYLDNLSQTCSEAGLSGEFVKLIILSIEITRRFFFFSLLKTQV